MSGQRSSLIVGSLAALAALLMQGCEQVDSYEETMCVSAVNWAVEKASYEALLELDKACGQYEANIQYCCEEEGAKLIKVSKENLEGTYATDCVNKVKNTPHTKEGVGSAVEEYASTHHESLYAIGKAAFDEVKRVAHEGCGTSTQLWLNVGPLKGLSSSARRTWGAIGVSAFAAAAFVVGTALAARRTRSARMAPLSRHGDGDGEASLVADVEDGVE